MARETWGRNRVVMANLVYRELLPPTGIFSAVFARITSTTHYNLVVSRATGVDVYTIAPDRLTLACSAEVAGTVRSLACVKLRGSAAATIGVPMYAHVSAVVAGDDPSDSNQEADVILLTFSYAKAVLLAWDPLPCTLRTVGMFNFEEASKGVGSSVRVARRSLSPAGFASLPVGLVDPKHTCVSLPPDTQFVVFLLLSLMF
jgi:hypothetical protein